MTAPLLALDLGNSRLKACALPSWEAAPSAVLEPGADLDLWLSALEVAPQLIGLSSVADAAHTGALAAQLEASLGRAPVVQPDCGLDLDLETPETTGRDRLYAARAAAELAGGPCLVVDVGTAMTVDAAQPGVFRGGAIAPGPDLLARALTRGGAHLPAFEPTPDAPALGRSTEGALQSGVGVGCEGAAVHLVERVAAEAGFPEDAPVYLTGGALAFVAAALGRGARPLHVDPLLVLRGVARALTP